MAIKNSTISDLLELSEGPHFDKKKQCLYYVDIYKATIFCYYLVSGKTCKTILNGKYVGFVIPVNATEDKFIIGLDRKVVLITWDSISPKISDAKVLTVVDETILANRLNDAKCDPNGRLWMGTMNTLDETLKTGSLYCLEVIDKSKNDISLTKIADKIGISNGLAWDSTHKLMYFIDSPTKKIRQYDYDLKTGSISNKKTIFDFDLNKIPGVPDGMCIDQNDKLWIACFGGSQVIRIEPKTGEVLKTIPIPAQQVTSVTFGGPKLDILFVTTARLPIQNVTHSKDAGRVFKIEGLNVNGVLPNEFQFY